MSKRVLIAIKTDYTWVVNLWLHLNDFQVGGNAVGIFIHYVEVDSAAYQVRTMSDTFLSIIIWKKVRAKLIHWDPFDLIKSGSMLCTTLIFRSDCPLRIHTERLDKMTDKTEQNNLLSIPGRPPLSRPDPWVQRRWPEDGDGGAGGLRAGKTGWESLHTRSVQSGQWVIVQFYGPSLFCSEMYSELNYMP